MFWRTLIILSKRSPVKGAPGSSKEACAVKVVGIVPSPSAVFLAVLESTSAGLVCLFQDEWNLSEPDRLGDYVALRKRLVERLVQMHPDVVCITAFEPFSLMKGKPQASWFKTAEVRGFLAEAARSVVPATELRSKMTIKTSMGKSVEDCRKDDALWARLASDLPKKYRDAALLALSRIDEG